MAFKKARLLDPPARPSGRPTPAAATPEGDETQNRIARLAICSHRHRCGLTKPTATHPMVASAASRLVGMDFRTATGVQSKPLLFEDPLVCTNTAEAISGAT